jgi:subfamily B ATP-binding cassette protein MsbA
LTPGAFVSFLTALLLLLAPIKHLTEVSAPLQRGLASAESVFELLDERPEQDTGSRVLPRARGLIEYERVSFAYPGTGREAVDGVSVSVKPGETVALVGPSGGGKTTFVNLLPRFYEVTGGRILIDGVDTRELTLASLRANVALVSQNVTLFNDTVAANIAYGRAGGASAAELQAAARAAHALDFVSEMPDGFDTMIGEDGVRLSGGQRQRLAIARALLKDAPILLLDEATSALDSESERNVQAALVELMRGRTTIVIAHRLSTIEHADRIVVLQRGRVAETGNHAELLAKDGVYAKLYRIQYALEQEAAS